MHSPLSNPQEQISHALTRVQTLRDEIRVQVHLAGMEAKDAWTRLEPQLVDAERFAKEATEASGKAIHDLVKRAETFLEELTKLTNTSL